MEVVMDDHVILFLLLTLLGHFTHFCILLPPFILFSETHPILFSPFYPTFAHFVLLFSAYLYTCLHACKPYTYTPVHTHRDCLHTHTHTALVPLPAPVCRIALNADAGYFSGLCQRFTRTRTLIAATLRGSLAAAYCGFVPCTLPPCVGSLV